MSALPTSSVKTNLPGGETVQVNQEAQSVDPSAAPAPASKAASPVGGKSVATTILGTDKVDIRFVNPA
jgi:hypothetical protein